MFVFFTLNLLELFRFLLNFPVDEQIKEMVLFILFSLFLLKLSIFQNDIYLSIIDF